MKVIVYSVFLLIFIYPFGSAQAQADINADNQAVGGLPALQFMFQEIRNKSKVAVNTEVVGSPFISENFQRTGIYTSDGLEGYVYSRYDGYNEELQLKKTLQDAQISKLLQREDIYCVINGTSLLYTEYYNKKNEFQRGHLFKIFDLDSIVIFERKLKKYKEGKSAANSFQLVVPNKFMADQELYFLDQDGKIKYLKMSKKNVLGLFKDTEKAAKINEFAKTKNISFKNVNGVSQILSYYKSL